MTREERIKQDKQDLRVIFQTKEGARFLSRLIDLCGVFRISYCGEETLATAFKEGARNIGLNVLSALTEIDGNALAKLAAANLERETREARD